MGSQATKPAVTVVSLKIERERIEALKPIAAANRRSVAQELRWLVDQRIAAVALEKAA